MTITCHCKNEYQDKAYGRGQRVWTPVNKSDARPGRFTRVRCTVCGAEHDAPKGSQGRVDDKEDRKLKGAIETAVKGAVKTVKGIISKSKAQKNKESKQTKRR